MTYTVTAHFGDVLCRGSYLKCWLYSRLLVPVGWGVLIEAVS